MNKEKYRNWKYQLIAFHSKATCLQIPSRQRIEAVEEFFDLWLNANQIWRDLFTERHPEIFNGMADSMFVISHAQELGIRKI